MPSSLSRRRFGLWKLTILGSFAAVLGAVCLARGPGLAMADDPIKPPAPAGDPAMGDPAMGDVPPPAPKPEPVPKTKAQDELTLLERMLNNKKAENADILAQLDTVAVAYHNLAPDDEAGKATFEDDKAKYQKEVEKAFIDAYKLKKLNAKAKANERDDVNIKAVQLLATFRPEVSDKITQILDTVIFKVKDDEYRVPPSLVEESFKTIGLLADKKKGVPWLLTFIRYPSGPGEPEKVKAAYDAMILMKINDTPGATRKGIVKDTIKFFIGAENAAQQNQDKTNKAQKETWDKLKTSVIKALQYFSMEPKDAKGAQFSKVAQFNDWFRDHDSQKDLWSDIKK
jgi:hypothetical protein